MAAGSVLLTHRQPPAHKPLGVVEGQVRNNSVGALEVPQHVEDEQDDEVRQAEGQPANCASIPKLGS